MSLEKTMIIKVQAAIASKKLQQQKEVLVMSYTDGRTDHVSDMSYEEASQLLTYINNLNQPAAMKPTIAGKGEQENNMRRKILAMCHNMAWYKRDAQGNLILTDEQPQLDFQRIDTFCQNKGPYKKNLQQHSYSELQVLITVFEKVLKSDLK